MLGKASRKLLREPAGRLLLAYAVIFSSLLLYGRIYFYRDPGSAFFDEKRAYERYYTQHRRGEAQAFLAPHGWSSSATGDGFSPPLATGTNTSKAGSDPQICVTFLTVRRSGEQYVEEAIGSLLAGLEPAERRLLHLGVFFAQTNPESHPTYQAPWLRKLVDSVYSYNLTKIQSEYVQHLERRKKWREKSLFDYIYALDWCRKQGAPYALLLEGDILLADSWLAHLLVAIRDAQSQLHLSTEDWLYMRLFNQERSTGWSKKHIGGNNELWICVGINAAVLGVVSLWRRISTPRAYPDNASLLVICMLVVPSAVVFFFQAGKASLLPPKPGLAVENFGCCSQALLYPRQQLPALVERLRNDDIEQYDLLVNAHARKGGLKRITLYPILTQHVGTSTFRSSKDEARSVWSAAFEALDPVQLRREHDEMLREVDIESLEYLWSG